ncbi:MAG TPA: hypothetical protein VGE85_06780, partial [Terracidiphilus sp.]
MKPAGLTIRHKKGHPAPRNGLFYWFQLGTCPVRLLEGGDGAGLVVLDIENGVQLGQLQQIVHLLGQLQQLDLGLLILGRGIGAH